MVDVANEVAAGNVAITNSVVATRCMEGHIREAATRCVEGHKFEAATKCNRRCNMVILLSNTTVLSSSIEMTMIVAVAAEIRSDSRMSWMGCERGGRDFFAVVQNMQSGFPKSMRLKRQNGYEVMRKRWTM